MLMCGGWCTSCLKNGTELFQGAGSYSRSIKKTEEDIQAALKKVNELTGVEKWQNRYLNLSNYE